MPLAIDPRNIEVIDDEVAVLLRAMTPADRIAQIDSANRAARLIAAAGIRSQYPDWCESQVHAEVLRRVCGGTS